MKNVNTGFRFDGNWSNFTYALDNGFTSDSNLDMQSAIAGIFLMIRFWMFMAV